MDNQILSHPKYNYTYHIVFIPKYRRKAMYGEIEKFVHTGNQFQIPAVAPSHYNITLVIVPFHCTDCAYGNWIQIMRHLIKDNSSAGYRVEKKGEILQITCKNEMRVICHMLFDKIHEIVETGFIRFSLNSRRIKHIILTG